MRGERPRDYYRRVEQRFLGARTLDVACGKKKFPAAPGIDARTDVSADVPHDLGRLPWPFKLRAVPSTIIIQPTKTIKPRCA